jgi:hypothetical protein
MAGFAVSSSGSCEFRDEPDFSFSIGRYTPTAVSSIRFELERAEAILVRPQHRSSKRYGFRTQDGQNRPRDAYGGFRDESNPPREERHIDLDINLLRRRFDACKFTNDCDKFSRVWRQQVALSRNNPIRIEIAFH